MELVGFGSQNFRSFGPEGFLVPAVEKINIFIGRNNSGKSNVLAALRLLSQFSNEKFTTRPTDQHQRTNDPIVLQFVVFQSVPEDMHRMKTCISLYDTTSKPKKG